MRSLKLGNMHSKISLTCIKSARLCWPPDSGISCAARDGRQISVSSALKASAAEPTTTPNATSASIFFSVTSLVPVRANQHKRLSAGPSSKSAISNPCSSYTKFAHIYISGRQGHDQSHRIFILAVFYTGNVTYVLAAERLLKQCNMEHESKAWQHQCLAGLS